MTDKIYDLECYVREFDANVISCDEGTWEHQKGYNIILDRTAFFPEEGGQASDTGTLCAVSAHTIVKVLHTSIADGIITHFCDKSIEFGTMVHGSINWENRYDRMQQHSGEHLFSGYVHEHFGYDNVGFHLGDDEVTLDFNGTFTDEELLHVEDIVNDRIWSNIETHIWFPTPEELAELPYRSKKELTGAVRIVEFPGYDICACCAPHVARTGEIGMLKIVQSEHFRGGTRITIKCGKRALSEFRARLEDCRFISQLLSARIPDVTDAVTKLNTAYGNSRFHVNELETELLRNIADKAISEGRHYISADRINPDVARETVNYMTSSGNAYYGIYVGSESSGYRFIIGSTELDCRILFTEKLKPAGAKGGGSERMIQGTVSRIIEF